MTVKDGVEGMGVPVVSKSQQKAFVHLLYMCILILVHAHFALSASLCSSALSCSSSNSTMLPALCVNTMVVAHRNQTVPQASVRGKLTNLACDRALGGR